MVLIGIFFFMLVRTGLTVGPVAVIHLGPLHASGAVAEISTHPCATRAAEHEDQQHDESDGLETPFHEQGRRYRN